MRYLLLFLIIYAFLSSLAVYHLVKQKPYSRPKKDTIYIQDTVYISGWWFTAYRCDSIRFIGKSLYAPIFTTQTKSKLALGIGLSYRKDLEYFIIGEYVLRDYFRVGGYYKPTNKEIGVYGKLEF